MVDLILKRIYRGDAGTFGIMYERFKPPRWTTLELPWHDNKRNISCIPPGNYTGWLFKHPKRGPVPYIEDVPGRSDILIHIGNALKYLNGKPITEGCILIGKGFGRVYRQDGIKNSTRALNELIDVLRGADGFRLSIMECADPV